MITFMLLMHTHMPQYHIISILYCSESIHQTTYEREHRNSLYGENYDNVGLSPENGPENKPSGDSEFVYNSSYGETHQIPQNTGDMYTYIASDSQEHKGVIKTDLSVVERTNPLLQYEPVEAGGDVVEEGHSYVQLN